jgi:hypothetical protein
MNHILCLGSSHTEGGWADDDLLTHSETKQFHRSWPGQLEQWLTDHDRDCRVINLGEASFSVTQYPFKLIMALQEWPITQVIVEVNTPHKHDIEISEQLHGHTVKGHTVSDRWSYATSELGRVNADIEKTRPYRTSVSAQEAADYYHTLRSLPTQNVSSSHTLMRLARELRDGVLPDKVKTWVHNKLKHITDHMTGTDRALEMLTDHLYFQAVYSDLSDHAIIEYCSHIDHIIEICSVKQIPCWLWFMHDTQDWHSHAVYQHTFKPRWQGHWLMDQELYALKPRLEQQHDSDQISSWLGDAIHFRTEMWSQWIDQEIGPWLINKL